MSNPQNEQDQPTHKATARQDMPEEVWLRQEEDDTDVKYHRDDLVNLKSESIPISALEGLVEKYKYEANTWDTKQLKEPKNDQE